jgi:WD40 repeat protein
MRSEEIDEMAEPIEDEEQGQAGVTINSMLVIEHLIITGCSDGHLRVFTLSALPHCKIKAHQGYVNHMAQYKGVLYTASSDKTIKSWDVFAKKPLFTFHGHTDWVNSIAVTPKCLFSGSRDKTVKIWNIATGELLHTFTGHTESVRAISVSWEKGVLVSAGKDK